MEKDAIGECKNENGVNMYDQKSYDQKSYDQKSYDQEDMMGNKQKKKRQKTHTSDTDAAIEGFKCTITLTSASIAVRPTSNTPLKAIEEQSQTPYLTAKSQDEKDDNDVDSKQQCKIIVSIRAVYNPLSV